MAPAIFPGKVNVCRGDEPGATLWIRRSEERVLRRGMCGVRDSFLLDTPIHLFTVVEINVAKVANGAKLKRQGGQVGHVEEVVDFSGFGSRWPRCPSYFKF